MLEGPAQSMWTKADQDPALTGHDMSINSPFASPAWILDNSRANMVVGPADLTALLHPEK